VHISPEDPTTFKLKGHLKVTTILTRHQTSTILQNVINNSGIFFSSFRYAYVCKDWNGDPKAPILEAKP